MNDNISKENQNFDEEEQLKEAFIKKMNQKIVKIFSNIQNR